MQGLGNLKGLRRPKSLLGLIVLIAAIIISKLIEGGGSGGGALSVEGSARVVDGDSVFVNGREVRMVGIDAPEGRQMCQRNGRDWDCGEEARWQLQRLTANKSVRCAGDEDDKHGRLLGTCYVGDMNLNQEMVALGFAVSYGKYKSDESAAKQASRGLWGSQFQRPKDWRHDRGIGR